MIPISMSLFSPLFFLKNKSDEETLVLVNTIFFLSQLFFEKENTSKKKGIEQYFDSNLWVGDVLYFVPYLSRLDSENNRGTINFDDIYVGQSVQQEYQNNDEGDGDQHYHKKRGNNRNAGYVYEGDNQNQGDSRNQSNTVALIPQGYQGFNWSGLEVVDVDQYNRKRHRDWDHECSRGLENSLVSLDNVAVNFEGGIVNITSSEGGLFSFNSAFLTAVCPSPQQISICGLRGGNQIYNVTLVLSDSLPVPFTPHWNDIDTLLFSSSIINQFGVSISPRIKTFFAIDDIILVPDSEANLLMNSINERFEQQNKRTEEVVVENKKMAEENAKLRMRVDALGEIAEENVKLRSKLDTFEEALNELKKRIQ